MDNLYFTFLFIIMANLFQVQSYNMRGFNSSCNYVCNVLNNSSPDVICLQETWHLKEMHQQFGNVNSNYTYVDEPGVDSSVKIHTGRLYGGQAILYKKSISGSVTKLDFKHKRILGIHIKGTDGDNDIVIITVYMPCDNRRADTVNVDYSEVLVHIEQFLA